jgi:hypothetical protein
MQHYDNVRAPRKRSLIASLLIRAIAPVFIVPYYVKAEFPSKHGSVIRTRVVGQNNVVNDLQRDLIHCSLYRFSGIVSRQDDCNLAVVEHAVDEKHFENTGIYPASADTLPSD